MRIFVSGPYSGDAEQIENNVSAANEAGKRLLRKGHLPFVPHTMMKGWQGSEGISWEDVVDADLAWLEQCDGFLFLGPSRGSNLELKRAKRLGLRIFNTIDEIPDSDEALSEMKGRSETQLQAYLTEYKDCADSYRHTYQTIWQAGAIFIAASALITAWTLRTTGFTASSALLAPLPFLFWFLAVFLPMNAYGEFRSEHLERIEKKLNAPPYRLDVNHYTKYNTLRQQRGLRVGVTTKVIGWTVLGYWATSILAWAIHFYIVFPSWLECVWPWLF